MDKEKLMKVLTELWINDENVPTPYTHRCAGLNWFSQGIKNNVVAHIAIEVLGLEEAKKLLEEPELRRSE